MKQRRAVIDRPTGLLIHGKAGGFLGKQACLIQHHGDLTSGQCVVRMNRDAVVVHCLHRGGIVNDDADAAAEKLYWLIRNFNCAVKKR